MSNPRASSKSGVALREPVSIPEVAEAEETGRPIPTGFDCS